MPELAYVNGQILPIHEAMVPVEDRGYQFGDAVYEYLASYNGQLFALEDHLNRLERSLQALDFERIDRDSIRKAILATFEQSDIKRAGLYLQISRGVSPRNHLFPHGTSPQVVITVRPAPIIPERLRRQGAKVISIEDARWKRCDIKTVQLLPNALAKQQAVDSGADDAIFVSGNGIVREGTSSNLFMVQNGIVHTHPLSPRILPGITRQYLLSICRDQGIALVEKEFDLATFLAADEIFLSGTVTEVLPVTTVDRQNIGDGRPGPVTQELYNSYRRLASAP